MASGPGKHQECLYYIIGNKCDLDESEREVSYEEGAAWVTEYLDDCYEDDEIEIQFVEVSAKDGTGINALFTEISVKLLERHIKMNGGTPGNYKLMHDPT